MLSVKRNLIIGNPSNVCLVAGQFNVEKVAEDIKTAMEAGGIPLLGHTHPEDMLEAINNIELKKIGVVVSIKKVAKEKIIFQAEVLTAKDVSNNVIVPVYKSIMELDENDKPVRTITGLFGLSLQPLPVFMTDNLATPEVKERVASLCENLLTLNGVKDNSTEPADEISK